MTITLNGTTGITDVNGTAAAPAITGTDTDSGMYFGTNTVGLATNGANAFTADATTDIFYTNGTEKARIDSYGALLINTSSPIVGVSNEKFAIVQNSATLWANTIQIGNTGNATLYTNVSGTASYTAITFRNNGTTFSVCGGITVSGTTTAYATSSDYRLKENIAPMTGALNKVLALKPVTYAWKSTGEADEGFIAHELQEVCPSAVVGDKDAVDADGNPKYQGIDTSFLVATLTAAIQEQQALITSLTDRIAALEAR